MFSRCKDKVLGGCRGRAGEEGVTFKQGQVCRTAMFVRHPTYRSKTLVEPTRDVFRVRGTFAALQGHTWAGSCFLC